MTNPRTKYVIFTSQDGTAWTKGGTIEATGQDAAIRQYVENSEAPHPTGIYLAIPTRSFQPVRVEPKVVTTTRLIPVPGVAQQPLPPKVEGITA